MSMNHKTAKDLGPIAMIMNGHEKIEKALSRANKIVDETEEKLNAAGYNGEHTLFKMNKYQECITKLAEVEPILRFLASQHRDLMSGELVVELSDVSEKMLQFIDDVQEKAGVAIFTQTSPPQRERVLDFDRRVVNALVSNTPPPSGSEYVELSAEINADVKARSRANIERMKAEHPVD